MHDQEEKKYRKINWKLAGSLMKGSGRYILFSALALTVAVVAAYSGPLIVSFTVDYVIGDKAPNLPAIVMRGVESLGGRAFLRENLWVCAVALVCFTLINGYATYLRRRYIAVASEGFAMEMRNRLYHHLQAVPYDYHKHASTGDLVQRCTSDVDTVRRFMANQLMEILRTLLMVSAAC